MKSYVRKLHKHDLTHEVSVQSTYVWSYFQYSGAMSFFNIKNPSVDFEVVVNDVTDPRFGGRFKSIYRNEGPRIGDFLVITRVSGNRFSLELVKSGSVKHSTIQAKFDCQSVADRHAVLDL